MTKREGANVSASVLKRDQGMIRAFLRYSAIRKGKYVGLWRRFGKPSLEDWTEYLRRHGGFQKIGNDCAINPAVVFTDPYLTSIGSNVWIAGGWLGGHDGSINTINRAYGTKFDSVGPILIEDNVFIGVGTHVLPGTRIGSNTIIGAGSVVSGTIEGNSVYAGVPARRIRSMDEHLARLEQRNASYPWRGLIESRKGGFDAEIEPELRRQRVAFFFGERSSG